MSFDEYSPLLLTTSGSSENSENRKGLSVFFAVICIIDVFGVFPIVALPKAVIQCGWLGIPLLLFVFSIQISTAIFLGKCWTLAEYLDKSIVAKNRYPYAAVAEMTFGKNFAIFVTILLDVTIFGGNIPNIIVGCSMENVAVSKIFAGDKDAGLIKMKPFTKFQESVNNPEKGVLYRGLTVKFRQNRNSRIRKLGRTEINH